LVLVLLGLSGSLLHGDIPDTLATCLTPATH
jgi:hypothetical protein